MCGRGVFYSACYFEIESLLLSRIPLYNYSDLFLHSSWCTFVLFQILGM